MFYSDFMERRMVPTVTMRELGIHSCKLRHRIQDKEESCVTEKLCLL